jgi:geranylgeranyl pyrophosphate synthase
MTTGALASIRELPGLHEYLDELEERLYECVSTHGGLVSAVGQEALAAGGKRLRPLLVFLAAPNGGVPSVSAGVAVELVHMATLVHDDLIDGARFRRGRASAWSAHGPDAARATGDYLFARAFAALSESGSPEAVSVLARATLSLARGEALQRSQRCDPATPVESYLERCALKTGTLFEAACLLGCGLSPASRLGDFGLWLGVAFQIADDILDCAGNRGATGKAAGTDLREGTPTLPLLLAAREDAVIRAALAGGPADGALGRVAATGALEQSRAVALDYARRACACLNGETHREELEALTHAVVNRER